MFSKDFTEKLAAELAERVSEKLGTAHGAGQSPTVEGIAPEDMIAALKKWHSALPKKPAPEYMNALIQRIKVLAGEGDSDDAPTKKDKAPSKKDAAPSSNGNGGKKRNGFSDGDAFVAEHKGSTFILTAHGDDLFTVKSDAPGWDKSDYNEGEFTSVSKAATAVRSFKAGKLKKTSGPTFWGVDKGPVPESELPELDDMPDDDDDDEAPESEGAPEIDW